MAPKPNELWDVRLRTADFLSSQEAMFALGGAIDNGKASMVPIPERVGPFDSLGDVAAPILVASECKRLLDASLWYASADMISLALAAAKTPPSEPFSERRVPSVSGLPESGLMVFEEPIGGYRVRVGNSTAWDLADPDLTLTAPIVAVSWSRWSARDLAPMGVEWYAHSIDGVVKFDDDYDGVWLTFYGSGRDRFGELPPDLPLASEPNGKVLTAGEMAARTNRTMPELVWDNEIAIPWGADLSVPPPPDTTAEWVHVVYTAWQLMSQRGRKREITETELVHPYRALRRRNARMGLGDPTPVQVVRLNSAHRPPAEASEADAAQSSGRRAPEWSHRWPVNPHRRQQCMNPHQHAAGGCDHEEIIIPFHVKGPKDMPFRSSRRVNLWDRQPE